MPAVEVRIDVARSPEEVFEFVADGYFENVRRWDRDLIEVTPLGDGIMALGARAVEVRREPVPRRGKRPVGRTVEVAGVGPPDQPPAPRPGSRVRERPYLSPLTFSPPSPR